jgi:TetR/AcrR family transcriptional regulator, tetracycline repressor protein
VRHAPLQRTEIVDAALQLLDDEGLGALTMRRLGGELGVEGMALYRHFPNKDALVDAVAAHLLDLVELPDPETTPWRRGVHDVVNSYRAVALAHPIAFRLLATRRVFDARLFDIGQCLLRLLERGGIGGTAGVRTYHTLIGLVQGATMIELTLGDGAPEFSGHMPTAQTHPLVVANLDELMACLGGENLDELIDQVIDGAPTD